MIEMPPAHQFDIGEFTIYYNPYLHQPYGLYRIFKDGKRVGSQISIPTASDCRWFITQRRIEIKVTNFIGRRKSTGRPRAAYSKWLEALT